MNHTLLLRRYGLLAFLLAALGAPGALAQTCSTEWAAPVDGSWSDDARWNNGAPGTESGGLAPCITVAGTYTVTFDVGAFGSQTVTTLVLGGASGTQALTLFSALGVTDATIRPNGLLHAVATTGGTQGFYATGTLTLEGVVDHDQGSFLRSGGTLDIAPGGVLRLGGLATAGHTSGLFRVRGTIEGVGCPFPINTGSCIVRAPLEVLGGTLRAASGVLQFQAGGTMNGATLDAGPTSLLLLNDNSMTVEGLIQGSPQGQVGMSGFNFAAGPAGATLAVGGTGLQMVGTSFLTSAGGSFTNMGLLLKAATGSNFSGISNGIVRNTGVIEIPSSLGLYAGGVLRNEPGGVVRATASGSLSGNCNGTGRFENAGLFVLDAPGQSFHFSDGGCGGNSGPFSRPGSELRVLAGTLDLNGPGARNLPAGAMLTGAGSIFIPGTFRPEGIVSPGTEAQPLARLAHGFYFYPSPVVSRLVIDVDTGGRSDTLDVSTFGSGGGVGTAILAGTLVVRVRPGYVPAVGDAFTILKTARTVTGQFEQIAVAGAPDGITFVAEVASPPGGEILVLRAVAAAPGGPITVSTTTPVGGGDRTIFLSGPGAPGVSAARLECTDCLDAGAFGTIPAQIVRENGLNEARFDLTSPRAFGFYDLVVQSPSQPDTRIPLTVRPYISGVSSRVLIQTGMYVRPATAPGRIHNFSPYRLRNVTNGPAAFPFAQIERPAPEDVSMILTSAHSYDFSFYTSDVAPDPLARPLLVGAIPAASETSFEIGLRIDPSAVLFPEQTPSGPDDDRIPFGEGRPLNLFTTANTTFERAAAAVRQGLLNTAHPQLEAYLASAAAVDPDEQVLGEALRLALAPGQRALTATPSLLAQILAGLDAAVPTPAGLADAAAPAFKDSLVTSVNDLAVREVEAYADAYVASPAVRDLYLGELSALGIAYDPPAAPRPGRTRPFEAQRDGGYGSVASGGTQWNPQTPLPESPSILGFECSTDAIETTYDPFAAYDEKCPRTSGSRDPNDKLADSDLLCEFGTVTIDGEEQTRCVRYFVPRARATEPVVYAITFENQPEATEPAEYVTITDEIDPNLNLGSLQIESTSSDSTFSYSVSGQTVTFRFVGIDLPPNQTAPEGEGFVRFSLRPNAGLPDGTEIRNDAEIVFDFNPPIVTPEVLHEIRTVSDIAVLIAAPDFIEVGSPLALDVVVANLRGDAAEETTVTIQTGGLPGVTATTTVGTCSGAGPIVCAFGTLEPDTFAEVTLTADAVPLGQYTISAATSTTSFDGFAANNTDAVRFGVVPVGNEDDDSVFPREVTLSQPYPNPSRGEATFRWGLPEAGRVTVQVYDLLGREVAQLADGAVTEPGWHETRWRGDVASGVYVVRMKAEAGRKTVVRTRRIVVVR